MKTFVVLVFLGTLSLVASQAQNPPPASDPRALALAAQSIAALTGGTPISDVTLSGNATWIAGSDNEIGSVTLMAKGTGESRVDLNLSGGTRTDIRNDTAGDPGGASATNGGSLQLWAFHNCWTTASWFFPALSSLSGSNPNIVLSYVGLENRSSNSLHHIRSYRYLASSHTQVTTVIQQLSTGDCPIFR